MIQRNHTFFFSRVRDLSTSKILNIYGFPVRLNHRRSLSASQITEDLDISHSLSLSELQSSYQTFRSLAFLLKSQFILKLWKASNSQAGQILNHTHVSMDVDSSTELHNKVLGPLYLLKSLSTHLPYSQFSQAAARCYTLDEVLMHLREIPLSFHALSPATGRPHGPNTWPPEFWSYVEDKVKIYWNLSMRKLNFLTSCSILETNTHLRRGTCFKQKSSLTLKAFAKFIGVLSKNLSKT